MSGNIIKRVIGVFTLSTTMIVVAPNVSHAASAIIPVPVAKVGRELPTMKPSPTPAVIPAVIHTNIVIAEARPSLEIRALQIAESKIGSPYRWGAVGPWSFDCSGLIYYSYRNAGKYLPRTAEEQQNYANRVYNPQPGDLVFFGWPAYHVGIYVGHGQFLNAPHSGDSVEIDPIWYDGTPSSYGRIY